MIKPTIDFETMVQAAEAAAEALTPAQVQAKLGDPGVVLIDLRDVRELEREGRIAGSRHVPRGMLEFWIHPGSPYFRDFFNQAAAIILHCNRGWRSALAVKTLADMGIEAVHMAGGFNDWKAQGLPVEDYPRKG